MGVRTDVVVESEEAIGKVQRTIVSGVIRGKR